MSPQADRTAFPPHVMTRDSTCPSQGHPHPPRFLRQNSCDSDVLASLWEEVPFARLPLDAPKELAQYVVDIENPKRVHAIRRASRRHNFQLLVDKYITQLRYGCESPSCSTPTCFASRKRHAGKAPLRRYNATSARTLAAYLASQDNPERGICPHLSMSNTGPHAAAIASLVFEPKRPHRPKPHPHPEHKPCTPALSTGGNKDDPAHDKQTCSSPFDPMTPVFTIRERPVSKDHRSFAANVFGTVAFKMLEWLTPNGVSAMTDKANELQARSEQEQLAGPSKTPLNIVEPVVPPQTPVRPHQSVPHQPLTTETPTRSHPRVSRTEKPATAPNPLVPIKGGGDDGAKDVAKDVAQDASTPEVSRDPLVEWGSGLPPRSVPAVSTPKADRPVQQRRNSNARVRAASASKPKRQVSIDTFQPSTDERRSSLRSPRIATSTQPEKASKPFLTAAPTTITRSLAQTTTEELFQRSASPEPILAPETIDITPVKEGSSWPSPRPSEGAHDSAQSTQGATSEATCDSIEIESDEGVGMLPQSLSRLNIEIVDLLCDILQEDGTGEKHALEPPLVRRSRNRASNVPKVMKRRHLTPHAYPVRLKTEWKIFIEQSIFNVLSDPCATVRSFTTDSGLLDSQSLWYCMVRITRVAPSLVLDSLWYAAGSLFAPSKRLQSLLSPTSRIFRIPELSLTSEQANHLMAICLHALVATAPVVDDTSDIFNVSRMRSQGLSIDNFGPSSSRKTTLCLQYDDAFSDELAMRLARRLFSAISTRRGFKELVEIDVDFNSESPETDVLDAIFSQLESITEDSLPSAPLVFTRNQREVHEKRVPTLLLDWARAVMLREWDGKPVFNTAGPFGGALALISAMYQKRHAFHIGDVDFRSVYFSDRLDSVEMPIAWMAHSSSRQKRHLLDYPYLFSPSTLVSYFRAVNFSRMNRSYEESSSLLNRMRHIMQQGSLISNDAHKQLLSDMLKTASCQYLILDIRRNHPLEDAFNQLWRREERELVRPLKVHLGEGTGEEGFDSGGVQQEFFRLAVAQALDTAHGLFTVDDRTRMAWFRPGGLQPEWKFELVGLIFSLAVYNGLTLPVTFPKALYRKLLGEPVTDIHHIADGWPDLANGLTTLLEWDEKDGEVEEIFSRTYEFSIETFGVHVSREMTPGPGEPSPGSSPAPAKEPKWPQWSSSVEPPTAGNPQDAPMVTGKNRNAYVGDYIRYLTHVSVSQQYNAFERGFRGVLHPKSLSVLSPSLLQNLVEGIQTIDVSELRRHTRYVGWDASHRTVRDFWSIVKRYDDQMKRRLLEFVTASDRVPVGGMRNVQFVVQKNGVQGKGGHLPTAYTCYGTLLLPEYRDKEVLRERLGMALENAQGFGFA